MVTLLLRWTMRTSTIAALAIGLHLPFATYMSATPTVLTVKNAQTTTVAGTSSGPIRDQTCAGFIAQEANHRIIIEQPSNLNFTLEGANDATLLILGNNNQRFCVQADQVSKGRITIPGRWETGQYEIFVGSRSGQTAAYQLTIGPMEI